MEKVHFEVNRKQHRKTIFSVPAEDRYFSHMLCSQSSPPNIFYYKLICSNTPASKRAYAATLEKAAPDTNLRSSNVITGSATSRAKTMMDKSPNFLKNAGVQSQSASVSIAQAYSSMRVSSPPAVSALYFTNISIPPTSIKKALKNKWRIKFASQYRDKCSLCENLVDYAIIKPTKHNSQLLTIVLWAIMKNITILCVYKILCNYL